MKEINVEHKDEVAVLRLNRGVTNALNLEFLQNISKNLQELNQDSSVCSVVLASGNDKFFSIGFDIPQLYELDKDQFKLFYKTYNRLSLDIYTLPKPTIAAITGHATAGGCILTLCCDYRFIAEGRKFMGLNEVKLGVPVPYPGDCILEQIVGARNACEIMEIGDFYEPEDSLRMGMVDKVVPLEQVLPKAVEKAKILGGMPNKAFEIIKRNRVEKIEAQVLNHIKEKEQLFLECWFSNETRRRLKEAIKKF